MAYEPLDTTPLQVIVAENWAYLQESLRQRFGPASGDAFMRLTFADMDYTRRELERQFYGEPGA